jgi:PAS domain S-box-containing protein
MEGAVPVPGGNDEDDETGGRRTAAGWHDLPLRAQGLVVLAVPVLGLLAAAVLVAVDVGRGDPSGLTVATLSILAVAVLAGAGATIVFMNDLARRVNHLRSNAERLARDAELAPGGPGRDELATAERTLARAAGVLAHRQRQLEEARGSLEHLVSAGPMVMFAGELATRLDDESPLLLDYMSSNSARVMGHSPVSLLNDPGAFIGLVHPEDVGPLLAAARHAVGEARSQVLVEFRIRHLDGSWRSMEGMVRGHETDPTRVLGYAVDITARRAAEQAQQESESRLSAFLDNSNALISLKDPFGRYQFANRALAELFGASGGHIVGTDDFDHWPDAAPMLRARDQQILVTREPIQFEEVIDLADGPHTFLSVKFPLLDAEGLPVAVGSISTDITEVKEALANVAARERVLSTVIGASPDVITILEDDGTIRTTSIAFERIFGYPTRALVDQRLVDVVHPDDRTETAERLAQLHDGRASRVTLRFRGRTADGVWVTIESHAQVITAPDGTHDGIVMVSRDITDQIALEQALRRAKEQAERASNAKSEFLSRVSHELRTPLNAMLGFTQLLELEELEERSTEYVEQISKAGDHLLSLINEVLDIARIESDNVLYQIEPIPALDAVQEVIDLTAPLAARAGVSLHGPRGGTGVLVEADRQRLLQVLLNLVSNAIKYNHEGGEVELTVDEHDGVVALTVTDTGPGLSDEQVERAFVPFDRLGLEHSGIEGTGVGLSLSRALTEGMGGVLTVSSTVGVGSAFVVELPATGSAPALPTEGPSLDADPRTGPISPPHPSLTGGRP